MEKLTDKQEKFVQGLIKGKSQREAYKAAYNATKMTDKTIDEKASILFSRDKVRARYDKIHDRIVKESEDECIMSAKEVLKELSYIAKSNAANYAKVVKVENQVLVGIVPTDNLTDEQQRAMAGIKQTQFGVEVKVHDKVKALELLGKHWGIFEKAEQIEDLKKLAALRSLFEDVKNGD